MRQGASGFGGKGEFARSWRCNFRADPPWHGSTIAHPDLGLYRPESPLSSRHDPAGDTDNAHMRPAWPRRTEPGMSEPAIAVTGGDSVYFPLIDELRRSLIAAAPGAPPAFGVIDAGLTEQQVAFLRDEGAIVVRVPDHPCFPAGALRKRPALAASFGKLWLDRLFPGYETILWLDGDTWVQDYRAVEMMLGAAQHKGALAIVPGGGRYWERQVELRFLFGGIGGLAQLRTFNFKNGRHAGLPLKVLRDLGTRALLNAGVYALRADSPHWEALRRWQAYIFQHGGKPFTSDQIAMGLSVYQDGLPVELLPTTCNYIRPWRVDLSVPAIVEFYYPYPKVGIVHLAGQKAIRFDENATAEVLDLEDRPHRVSLRYGHFQRTARQHWSGHTGQPLG